MLKFYYSPVSGSARRVWIALLEKQIPFELSLVNLNGDQFEYEFTAINPFQRVPVIIDNGLRVVESLAILDYLEAKYPTPALMPTQAEAIATVRMVEMLVASELQPAMGLLSCPMIGLTVEAQKLVAAKERVMIVMQFYEKILGEQTYFVGEKITLADIVAGVSLSFAEWVGISWEDYPQLKAWLERLAIRESWQQTAPSPEAVEAALPNVRKILERRM
jgi:glutathione S-transferase